MRWFAAVALIAVALVGGGAWLAFGDRLVASGTAGAAVAVDPPQVAGDAGTPADPAPDPEAVDGPEGAPARTPVEPLVEAPVRRFEGAEDVLDPELDYAAVIETTAGSFTVDLYDDLAPRTVNNFVFLALHRYYEDVPFHRVLEDFMAQTGDPTGTGSGGPGYVFDDEIVPELRHDAPGLLSMANAGPDTNGSQFFVTFAATPWLDGKHAVFGAVVDGRAVLDDLTRIDPQTPSALARLSAPAADLADQGVTSLADATGTVEAWLTEELGTLPVQGQSFQIGGRRGVLGTVSGAPAVGLFPVPDRIERITVMTAPEEDPS